VFPLPQQSGMRVYMTENVKVVTQVYSRQKRREIESGLKKMLESLEGYQAKYESKTLRLCFSTEKELYSIFAKIFPANFFKDLTIRKVSK
jgi:hypothetical protein